MPRKNVIFYNSESWSKSILFFWSPFIYQITFQDTLSSPFVDNHYCYHMIEVKILWSFLKKVSHNKSLFYQVSQKKIPLVRRAPISLRDIFSGTPCIVWSLFRTPKQMIKHWILTCRVCRVNSVTVTTVRASRHVPVVSHVPSIQPPRFLVFLDPRSLKIGDKVWNFSDLWLAIILDTLVFYL